MITTLSGEFPKDRVKATLKRHNLTYSQKLNNAFNFTYAGVCDIFISFTGRKYIVVTSGFICKDGIVLFSKNAIERYKFNTLYNALQYFQYLICEITSSLDWYKPDFFDSDEFYEIANNRVYN